MKKSEAIAFFGSVPALAKALGIDRRAIYQWGENVPRLRAFELEKITGGALRVESMSAGDMPVDRDCEAMTTVEITS